MRHSWQRRSKVDVDLEYSVDCCSRCGTEIPASCDPEEADLSEYGVSYDCDVQVVKSVMRS